MISTLEDNKVRDKGLTHYTQGCNIDSICHLLRDGWFYEVNTDEPKGIDICRKTSAFAAI